MGTYHQDIAHQKTLAQLAYELLSNQTKYDQALQGTGYQLDPSMSNEETKVFHNLTTQEK